MAYIGILINAVLGGILYFTPSLAGFGKYAIMIGVLLLSCASLFVFGTFSLGWSMLMSPQFASQEKPGTKFYPGSEQCLRIFKSTMFLVTPLSGFRFWLSVLSSFLIMFGLMMQGWTIVLVLEVLSSSVGYGFLSWAIKNKDSMYARTHLSIPRRG